MNYDVNHRVEHYCEVLNSIKELLEEKDMAAIRANIQLASYNHEIWRIEWSEEESRFRITQ